MMIRQDCTELNDQAPLFLCTRPEIPSNTPFKDWACKVFCLYYFDEQLNNFCYTVYSTLKSTFIMYDKGILDAEFSLYENIDGVNKTLQACQFLGIPAIDVHYEGKDYQCATDELEILKLVKPGFAHFVPGNGYGEWGWDSLGIRPAQKDYVLQSKRIITLDKEVR